jgi:hypothetical protein
VCQERSIEVTEEAHNPNEPLSSYESLRDSARGQAASLWKTADKEEASLGAYYEQLRDDPRFTEEHKSELAWGRYNQAKEKIVEGREKASEQLAADAATYHRQSLPMPGGEGPITQDLQKILVTQNETQRISRKLARLREAPGRFRPDITSTLRQEYGRGLEVGGVMGGALCRAVLAVCDEQGVDPDSVVDGFRKDRHRELIERAQHAEYLQNCLGRRVKEPPFAKSLGEKARIAGMGGRPPQSAEEQGERSGPRRGKRLFPDKPQSHISRGRGSGMVPPPTPEPTPDEVSKQRTRRGRKKKG